MHERASHRLAAGLLSLALLGACGPKIPEMKAPLPPSGAPAPSGIPQSTVKPPPPLPAPPAAAARAIAVAEDQRQYADGVLKRYLADPSPSVRARAALAVGRLQDSTTVADLLPLLDDKVVDVRREAAFALGQIGHKSARAPLEAKLADKDPETVGLAIEALGKLGDKASTAKIAEFLRTGIPDQRRHAAVALWRLADSTALTALIAAHNDPDLDVRWRVIYAMEKIVAPERVVLVAALHLNEADWSVRAFAARTMGRQKSDRATAYLLGALRDGHPAVVVNAIRAVQLIADSTTRGVASGLARSLGHADPYVRVTAATALGERFAWVGADSTARAALNDSLRIHLGDNDAATRGAVARALLLRGAKKDQARAKGLLEHDPSIYTRVAVIGAWPPDSAAALIPWLDAKRELFIRASAADRLGEVKAKKAIAPLRAGLADTSVLFVASCAGALASLGDKASVPALSQAWNARAGDADADARIAIRDALRDLAGRAYADSLERLHPAPGSKPASYPDDFATPPAARGAILHTSAGDVEWAFFGREAPQTVKNFVRLAERHYFDGLVVHRVVPNFVIQDGDPTGTGSGGPGYTIRCEYNRIRYDEGMVGMALSGKDTGGGQWFITHSPQPHLNGKYTIFAHVVRGQDVVWRIVQGDSIRKVDILK